jgi:hypothetical protein
MLRRPEHRRTTMPAAVAAPDGRVTVSAAGCAGNSRDGLDPSRRRHE